MSMIKGMANWWGELQARADPPSFLGCSYLTICLLFAYYPTHPSYQTLRQTSHHLFLLKSSFGTCLRPTHIYIGSHGPYPSHPIHPFITTTTTPLLIDVSLTPYVARCHCRCGECFSFFPPVCSTIATCFKSFPFHVHNSSTNVFNCRSSLTSSFEMLDIGNL